LEVDCVGERVRQFDPQGAARLTDWGAVHLCSGASSETAPFVSICRRFLRDIRHAYTPDGRELNMGR